MLPVNGYVGIGTPACCQTQVANRAHHSSHGPYGLQNWPRTGSLFTWLLATDTIAEAVGEGAGLGGLVKAYDQPSGSSSQYPWASGVSAMPATGGTSAGSPP